MIPDIATMIAIIGIWRIAIGMKDLSVGWQAASAVAIGAIALLALDVWLIGSYP